jgi:hypothetical protein
MLARLLDTLIPARTRLRIVRARLARYCHPA